MTKRRNFLLLILTVSLAAATSIVSADPISGDFTGISGGAGANGSAGANGASCVGGTPGEVGTIFVCGMYVPGGTAGPSGGAGSPGFIGGSGGFGLPGLVLGSGVTASITNGTFVGGAGGNAGIGGKGGNGGDGTDGYLSPAFVFGFGGNCFLGIDCPNTFGGAAGSNAPGAPGGSGGAGGFGLLVFGTNSQIDILGGDFSGGQGGAGGAGGSGGSGGSGGVGEQNCCIPNTSTPIVGGAAADGGKGGSGGAGGLGGTGVAASGIGVDVDIFAGMFFGGAGGAGGDGGNGGLGGTGGYNFYVTNTNIFGGLGGAGGAGGLGFGFPGSLGQSGLAGYPSDGFGGAPGGHGGSGGRGGQAGFFGFGLLADDNAIIEIHASDFLFDRTTGELFATFFDGSILDTFALETRGGQIIWSQDPLVPPGGGSNGVPAPATLALVGIGFGVMGFSRRRFSAQSRSAALATA
jgi:hypothetical protein